MARTAGVALLLSPVLLALLAAWPALDGDFVRDDFRYVVANAHVTEPVGLAVMFATPFAPELELGLYRPLATLSFRLDFVLAHWLCADAPHPTICHVTNGLLAAFASVLVAVLGRRLGLGAAAAAAAAALFAVHAARSEAVCWIAGRAEDLMALFVLGALVAACGPAGRWRTTTVGLLAAAAMLSKEQGAVTPLLLLLLPHLAGRWRLRCAAAAGLAVGVVFGVRWLVLGQLGPTGAQQILPGTAWTDRAWLGLGWFGDYARLSLWPQPLCNEYDDPAGTPGLPALLPGIGVAAAAVALALWARRRPALRPARFAAALFAVPLLPVLNVAYRTGEPFAERFLALPIAGFCLLAALPASRWRLGVALPCALALLNLPLSMMRAADWRSERAVCEALVRDAADAGCSHLLLGTHLAATDLGDDPALAARVLQLYQTAVARAPQQQQAHLELAKLLQRLATANGTVDAETMRAAAEHARRAAELAPESAEPCLLLGQLHARAGQLDDAEQALQEALRREPRAVRAALQLAELLDQRGKTADRRKVLEQLALVCARDAGRRWWDGDLAQGLAQVLFLLGRPDESLAWLAEARRRPSAAVPLARIASVGLSIHQGLGRERDGQQFVHEVGLELDRRLHECRPRGDIYVALAELARAQGDAARAIAWLRRALALSRTDVHRAQLRRALRELGDEQPR